MSQSHDEENTYQLDPEHESELTRLILQSRFMTAAQGGLFSEEEIQPRNRVIDLACGPGDWALDLAIAYKEQGVEVVGIDISKLMIEYARAQATALGVQNVGFATGTILKPLPFLRNILISSTHAFSLLCPNRPGIRCCKSAIVCSNLAESFA